MGTGTGYDGTQRIKGLGGVGRFSEACVDEKGHISRDVG